MTQVTLEKHGDRLGIVFPPDLEALMGLEIGERLIVVVLHDGIKLVKGKPELERQIETAKRVLGEQTGVLRGLAEYDRG